MKKGIVIGVVIAVVIVIGIFAFSGGEESNVQPDVIETNPEVIEDSIETTSEDSDREETVSDGTGVPAWMDVELIDVTTEEPFTISQFVGKPILIESFAVWCPICTAQQRNIHDLKATDGDSFVSISLDTDASEDAQRVRDHLESNGFEGYYAVSPIELTQMLIDEFGNSVVSAPSVPIILVCEDGSFRKLGGFGARSADTIKSEIAAGCA